MTDYNKLTYFLMPLDQISDDMIAASDQTSRETMRKSLRPINGKIYGLLKFGNYSQATYGDYSIVPDFMKPFLAFGFDHKTTLDILNNSREWNFQTPLEQLRQQYDFAEILDLANSHCYIEAFGRMHIAIFACLKTHFVRFCQVYLNHDIEKWRVFRSKQFEDANEYSLLQLCYFFDVITKSEERTIEKFRIMRNAITHSFDWDYDENDFIIVLSDCDELISRLFRLI